MEPSQKIIDFIKSYEGCRLEPYADQGGRMTIGWGHLIDDDEDYSDGITQEEADDLFLDDLGERAVVPVDKAIQICLSQQEFDACISLCFNIGANNFSKSSIVRMLNSGQDVSIITEHFMLWNKINGASGLIASEGLLKRRMAEADIFLNGNYVNHS